MSSYRGRGGPPLSGRRSYPRHDRSDFYDDRRSPSRSPDRRYNSPTRRRSPPYDISRAPRGPAKDDQKNFSRSSPDRYQDRSRDRGRYYNDSRSSSPRGRGGYYDRDRPYDDDEHVPINIDRSRSPRRDRSSSQGKPSKEIMLDGLAPHLTENDISAELKQHYHVNCLDDVRIIRDRQTKQSRQFGFLRFSSLEDAVSFMDRNYPSIYLYGDSTKAENHSTHAKVRINYGKERKDIREDENDWICSSCNVNNYATRSRCFRCQAPKTESAGPIVKPANVGDNDASPDNIPSQFLLIRGLEASVTEELFAKGVTKLNKPTGTASQPNPAAAKKGAKVASTTGDANLGAKEGTLRRVLLVRDRRSNDSWRYGFAEYATIDDAQAALTRFNSFDRFTIASKQVLVSYIHAGVFVPVLTSTPSTERFFFTPLGNPSLKLQYWDENAYLTELVVAAPEPADVDNKAGQRNLAEKEGLKSLKESDKGKKRKGPVETNTTSAKKPAPSHLQFWSNRHAELHNIQKKTDGSSAPVSESGDDNSTVPTQSWADPTRNCCYLCQRQFTSAAEVNKHERLSDLHRANLKDEAKVTRAKAKMEKHGIPLNQPLSSSEPTLEYRDRAKERRKIYGVVNKKGEQVSNKARSSKTSSDDEDGSSNAPVQSKGASLLSKMGYTAGQGLGASGEGMTAPISQDVYVAGVGLGAQGGKVGDAVEQAELNTKGDFASWTERGKEAARERYSRME